MNHNPITHYSGDTIRIIFVVTVGISFLAMPFWGNTLPLSYGLEILGGIIFIALAGLTNPHGPIVMGLNAVASAVGVFLFEFAAITNSQVDPIQLLFVREIAAVLLLIALYFSVKSLRAMMQGIVGDLPKKGEFECEKDSTEKLVSEEYL
ncbi:hypothetical protein KKH15_01615 [Patescibacteria group bacterium]|nr:hypothetical protein [Patescibacteria group bacterium]MBU1755353.1 hypothetical protein [Patescibacteria group bacterium]